VPVDSFCRSFRHCTLVQLGAEYLDFCISSLFLIHICSIIMFVCAQITYHNKSFVQAF